MYINIMFGAKNIKVSFLEILIVKVFNTFLDVKLKLFKKLKGSNTSIEIIYQ